MSDDDFLAERFEAHPVRLSRGDARRVDNLEGRLTTAAEPGPEQDALLADSVGSALLVVLDTLTPAERLVFVLYELFGVGYDEIGGVIGESPVATRRLAGRARRRVRGADTDPARRRELVDAFLAAAREGDFDRTSWCARRSG